MPLLLVFVIAGGLLVAGQAAARPRKHTPPPEGGTPPAGSAPGEVPPVLRGELPLELDIQLPGQIRTAAGRNVQRAAEYACYGTVGAVNVLSAGTSVAATGAAVASCEALGRNYGRLYECLSDAGCNRRVETTLRTLLIPAVANDLLATLGYSADDIPLLGEVFGALSAVEGWVSDGIGEAGGFLADVGGEVGGFVGGLF